MKGERAFMNMGRGKCLPLSEERKNSSPITQKKRGKPHKQGEGGPF